MIQRRTFVQLHIHREIAKRKISIIGETRLIAEHAGVSLGDFAIRLNKPRQSPHTKRSGAVARLNPKSYCP